MRVLDSVPGFYVPESARYAEDVSILRNNRRVKEYDERLRFGYHEAKGDYAVFMMMPHGESARPILGFGKSIPPEDELMERLIKSDTRRHGEFMRDDINAHNARQKKEEARLAAETAHSAAERVEVWHRQYGSHPSPRVFIPDSEGMRTVSEDVDG